MKRTSRNICPFCDAGDPTSVVTECDCEEPQVGNMKAQHTPGPWHVTASDPDGFVCDRRGNNIVPYGYLDGNMTPERWANARLIAAAPDLLAVAVSAASCWDFMSRDMGLPAIERAAAARKAEEARAAIAKARGEGE